jgi:3-methyladenine DNA glycosylase AlkD
MKRHKISPFTSSLTKTLKNQVAALPRDAALRKHYMNTQLSVLGLTIPEIRLVVKNVRNSTDNNFLSWHQSWQESDIFEVKAAALIALEDKAIAATLVTHWPALTSWVVTIDNWAHSDGYSGIIAKLLETSPKTILPTLKQWNKSPHPWERRQSLVSLFYYTRHRKLFPEYPLVEKHLLRLIDDKDIYVQKAVGWTIRECWQAYEAETRSFLLAHISKLTSIAFSSATEKVDANLKKQLLEMRSNMRQRSTLN